MKLRSHRIDLENRFVHDLNSFQKSEQNLS